MFRNLFASARKFSSASVPPEAYPFAMKFMHWTMGTAILGCVVNVKIAQQYNFKGNSKEDK